jgi:hypothetical protein
MKSLLGTEEERYSLTTLRALHYGATYSGASSHGILRITYLDNFCAVHAGRVLSIGPSGVSAREGDGTLRSEIKPSQILHAEVV